MSILEDVYKTLLDKGIDKYVVLKGGFLLESLLELRGTKDIDFSYGSEESWYKVVEILKDTSEYLLRCNKISNYEIKYSTGNPPTSTRLVLITDKERIHVDLSYQDLSFGVATLTVRGYDLNCYTYERILADKIHATFSQKQFRRTKDLFDIYTIITTQSISHREFSEALSKRPLQYQYSPFRAEAIPQWQHSWARLNLDRDSRLGIQHRPDLQSVLDLYSKFMVTFFDVTSCFSDVYWNPKGYEWNEFR